VRRVRRRQHVNIGQDDRPSGSAVAVMIVVVAAAAATTGILRIVVQQPLYFNQTKVVV
jgi:hypothetical protein